MKDPSAFIRSVEATVGEGRAVFSADDSVVVSMMQHAIRQGQSATFYTAPNQAQAMMNWFWTDARVKSVGLERIADEERSRIEKDFRIEEMGPWYSNRIECSCGGVFGAYEFVQQGIEQHGRHWVGAILALKDTSVVRINPLQRTLCPDCGLIIIRSHNYAMYDRWGTMIYGCCSGPDIIVIA